MLNELQFRLLLCGTGKTRPSAGIVADQIKRYVEHREDTVGALHRTRELAVEMRKALLLGQVDEIGVLLNEAWIEKRKFSSKVTDPQIDDLYEEACKAGAIGGKLLGAGGGGYLLILCESGKRYQVAQRLEALGGHLMDFSFGTDGAQTWEVKDDLH
jgi:D-glycero-alpha-D-manno-heptose-7-phosphate kinase